MTKWKWDFKNSPAASHLKKAGKKASKYLGLDEELVGRNDHFHRGATEHAVEIPVLEKDVDQAKNLANNGAPPPFSKENVSSITNAFVHRERKAPPEGY